MSTIKLGSPKEFEKFLKILAEESVTLAKAGLDEPQRQKMMAKGIKRDKASLTEEEPEKAENPPEAKQAAPPPQQAPAPEKPAAPTPSDVKNMDLNPSLDELVDAIRDVRGGRGTGDSAIESELTAYFDRLEEAERTALIVMLRSIGGIMQQNLTGADAPEPEQYNILTTKRPGENAAPEKPATSAPAAATAPASPEGEDTSPPIRVGEPVSEAYRSRIKDLLSRAR